MKRREFLQASAAATIAASVLPSFNIARAGSSPNSQLVIGCIGMGRKARYDLSGFMSYGKVVAVCDVDTTRREDARRQVNAYYENQDCAGVNDYRELLAREDIDVVVISTPDHWHTTMAIDAARAGKNIYCEKPLTHDIEESIRIMQEVKKSGVIFQTGSQQRSMKEFRVAAELVRNEVAGKVMGITSNFWGPARPCDLGEEELEPGLDWNRWIGPADYRPYHSVLSPRGIHDHWPQWRAFREFGGGGVCDMGAHHLDIVQWALGMDGSGPVKAAPPPERGSGPGARLVYANGIEVTRMDGHHLDVECEHGRIQASRGKFRLELDGKTVHQYLDREDGSLNRAIALTEREFLADADIRLERSTNGHIGNFVESIASGKTPIAPVEVGARSAICCHLMNLAYYHQQDVSWDPVKLQFADDSCDPAWLTGARRALPGG